MGKQLGFYVNQQFCMGCKTCQIACKDKHDNEVGVNFTRVTEYSGGGFKKVGNGYQNDVWAYWTKAACNHCDNPKCVEACPTGAADKNAVDGTVSIDRSTCIGCKLCVKACPYGAPQFSLQKNKAGKCDLCADYRAEGKEPACAAACPIRAIEWGEVAVLKKRHPEAVRDVAGLPDSGITSPNTVYSLHRHAVAAAKRKK